MSHYTSALHYLGPEHIFKLLEANKYYLDIFWIFIVAVSWCSVPCSIRRTHGYGVSLGSRESTSPRATAAWCTRLPLHVIILLPFAPWMYQATELETFADFLQIGVPNTPRIGYLTCHGLLFYFNSILSRDYNPVYPSPLAFIILLLEIILFRIALSLVVVFRGAWMTLAEWIAKSPAGTLGTHSAHTRHTGTIRPLPIMVILLRTYKPPFITSAILERRTFRFIGSALGIVSHRRIARERAHVLAPPHP